MTVSRITHTSLFRHDFSGNLPHFSYKKKWVFQKTHWEFLATGILWRSVCIAQEKGIQRQRCTDDSGHSKYLSGGTRQVHKRKKDNKLLRNPITSKTTHTVILLTNDILRQHWRDTYLISQLEQRMRIALIERVCDRTER